MSAPTLTSASLSAALRAGGFVGPVVGVGRAGDRGRAPVDGAVPGDAAYDSARATWNGAVDRRPAAVACATDADDVAAAVRAARERGTAFTIRAGGHSVPGRSVHDDALCIDIRGLRGVAVDPARRLVRAGGGALLGELDRATQRHGLAVPAGQVSHTGIGGLTLGGGLGWLMRRHGLTIDSLLAAEVVLADGSVVRAAEDEHPELFWALRGGGGDFGAVTRFDYRGHPVGPTVLGGMLVYPWERAGEVMRAARDHMAQAPDELGLFAVLLTAPPEPPFPPALQGRPAVALSVAWAGDLAAGERALAPLRRACPPAADLVEPMPYVALQSMIDPTAPHGYRYHDRLHYVDAVGDGLIDAMLAAFESVPTPQSHVITGWMGGAIDRVAPGATAFGHRGIAAEAWIIGCAADGPLEPVAGWVRDAWDEMAPFATGGTYVNALHAGRSIEDAYAGDILDRLRAVKRRYDPEGAFRGNGIG